MHMFMDCLKSSLKVMKKHYFVFVIICVLSMLIGGEFLDTQNFSRIALLSTSDSKNVDTETDKISIYTVLNYWHLGEDEESSESHTTKVACFLSQTEFILRPVPLGNTGFLTSDTVYPQYITARKLQINE